MFLNHFCRVLIVTTCLLLSPVSGSWAGYKLPVRIGYTPLVSQLPIILSYYYDQFSYHCLQPSLIRYNSFTSLEAAFRVGAIDIALIPTPIALSMAADDVPVTLLGHISRGGSQLIAKYSGDYKQLKGKVIGVPGLDSNENIHLRNALSQNGLRYGLDYKAISVPMNSVLEDLRSGRIDALYYPEPYGTIALHQNSGFSVLAQEPDLSANNLYVLVIRSSYVNIDKRYAVIEWLHSIAKACDTLKKQAASNEVEDIPLLEFDDEIIEYSLKEQVGGITFGLFPIDFYDLRRNLDDIIELKILYKSIAFEGLIANDLFHEVLSEAKTR